ncbi:bifunctional 2-polyprenyl-6-hydroxyphenol methylase/3-demethylubiquinol 3-O-methyltransferase UbiG, partial [Pantoea sp. GbtcB22]|uniref:class I SAM-dependent methyltransferase n=1 Tax=Pantoea sp. GbtcB22 TaxID=2824767 RepID=UPI001C2FF3D1
TVNNLGFKERGIDLDEAMLSECGSRGLTVEQGDALAILQSFPENSVAIVTAFHVVEHMEIDKINSLIINSLRELQPGGLLILETPNPE